MIRIKTLLLAGAAVLPLAFQNTVQEPMPKETPAVASVGAPAPKIRLNDQSGTPIQFGSPDRWTVLAFFPRAATPG